MKTVRDLLEELGKFPPEARVQIEEVGEEEEFFSLERVYSDCGKVVILIDGEKKW